MTDSIMRRAKDERERILQQHQLLLPDKYEPLKSRPACHMCTKTFGTFRRRVHCQLVCFLAVYRCTLEYIADVAGKILDTRVCTLCDAKLDADHRQRTSSRAIAGAVLNLASKPRPSPMMTRSTSEGHTPNTRVSHHRTSPASTRRAPKQQSTSTDGDVSEMSTPYFYALDFNWSHAWPKPPFIPHDMERVKSLTNLQVRRHDFMLSAVTFACEVFDSPIGGVSFLDEHQQWFACSQGLAQEFIPRMASICAHTIALATPMTVLNLRQDIRFRQNPLVTGPKLGFYAGAPILSPEGHAIGTVFVMDMAPRGACDLTKLAVFAQVVSAKLADAARPNLTLLRTESSSSTTSQIQSPTESTTSLPYQSNHPAGRVLAASEVMRPTDWVPSAHRVFCQVCHNRFSLFLRKRHCRVCGDVVCKNCITHTPVEGLTDPSAAKMREVVVCLGCVHKPRSRSASRQKGGSRTAPATTMETDDDEECVSGAGPAEVDVPTLGRNQSFDLDECGAAFTTHSLRAPLTAGGDKGGIVGTNATDMQAPPQPKQVDYTPTEVHSMLLRLLHQSNDIQSQLHATQHAAVLSFVIPTIMRVFVSNLSSALGAEIAKQIKDCEVVGAIEHLKQTQSTKKRLLENRSPELVETASSAEDPNDAFVENPVVVYSDKHNVGLLLKRCDVAIYSILDDPDGVVEALKTFDDGNSGDKLFIAISSVLTWAKTPVPAPRPEDWNGHREDTFKTRKPARKYAEYKAVETQVLSARREGLTTLVIAPGLIYGGAQSSLHAILRNAWLHPEEDVVVPSLSNGKGANVLPMISVYDLARVVAKAAVAAPSTSYLIAVDKSHTSLRDVCSAISKTLGSGGVRDVDAAEAEEMLVLEKSMAHLQLDLRFDTSGGAMDALEIEWTHELGLVANIARVADDYIKCMDLRPLRAVVLGPPQVGKSHLSAFLAKTYYLPHLTPSSVAADLLTTANLDDHLVGLREEVKKFRLNLKDLPEALLTELIRWKLTSPVCRNQGYVLDGLPVSVEQARALYFVAPSAASGDDESKQPDDGNTPDEEGKQRDESDDLQKPPPPPSANLSAPNRVVVLDAVRSLLEHRAQALSQEDADKSGNTDIEFTRRYDLFKRETNPANQSGLVAYFERDQAVEVLELELDSEEMYTSKKHFVDPIAKYMEQGGKPYNFHPTPD
ncbi:hypothetical protein DYB31_011732, partial [Aphanomyces astaci]